jgi:hypothetical protein
MHSQTARIMQAGLVATKVVFSGREACEYCAPRRPQAAALALRQVKPLAALLGAAAEEGRAEEKVEGIAFGLLTLGAAVAGITHLWVCVTQFLGGWATFHRLVSWMLT